MCTNVIAVSLAIQTQIIFALSPLFIAGFSWGGQHSTLYIGRVWAVIALSMLGVFCLLGMVCRGKSTA
jgi:drug/metabolite transporter (DMT)-like permease